MLQIELEILNVGRKKASKRTNEVRALNSTLILPLKTMYRVFRLKDLHTSLGILAIGIPRHIAHLFVHASLAIA